MDVPARWSDAVRRPEHEIHLDEAALLIGASANPSLDVTAELSHLDDLAAQVDAPTSAGVRNVLFDRLGLSGDRESYDDPRNSYLDQVLRRRRGIPISLSVLLLEVARRCGVRLEPIGMPGHFLVRDPVDGTLIDAFTGGRLLAPADGDRLLRSVTGGTDRMTPELLVPIGSRAVLARMLRNLDQSFDRREDRASLLWVSELRRLLPGRPVADRAQLAGRLATLGRLDAAASVLEEAAEGLAGDGAATRLLADARLLRARLN